MWDTEREDVLGVRDGDRGIGGVLRRLRGAYESLRELRSAYGRDLEREESWGIYKLSGVPGELAEKLHDYGEHGGSPEVPDGYEAWQKALPYLDEVVEESDDAYVISKRRRSSRHTRRPPRKRAEKDIVTSLCEDCERTRTVGARDDMVRDMIEDSERDIVKKADGTIPLAGEPLAVDVDSQESFREEARNRRSCRRLAANWKRPLFDALEKRLRREYDGSVLDKDDEGMEVDLGDGEILTLDVMGRSNGENIKVTTAINGLGLNSAHFELTNVKTSTIDAAVDRIMEAVKRTQIDSAYEKYSQIRRKNICDRCARRKSSNHSPKRTSDPRTVDSLVSEMLAENINPEEATVSDVLDVARQYLGGGVDTSTARMALEVLQDEAPHELHLFSRRTIKASD